METPIFDKLWEIKCRKLEDNINWFNYEIYAILTKDVEVVDWNSKHPYEDNITRRICKEGTKVRVWMVSRFGDVGITDNLINPNGYNIRGLNADTDLSNYEFILKNDTTKQK